MADRARPQRVVADRGQDGADRRAHDAQRDHDADEIAGGEKPVHRPAGADLVGEAAELRSAGVGTPGNPFSPPVQAESGQFSTKKNISAIATVIMAK